MVGIISKDSCRKNVIYKAFKELSSKVAPEGCFTVYVGAQKQRFVVKTEHANHPLFGRLLDEAASEYGFQRDGPILLPCNVHFFSQVLAQMDSGDGDDDDESIGDGSSSGGVRGYLSPASVWMQ
ncbi:hypothetical protein CDL15_Pgr009103 [Punica granatum]|uniref:Uncharacterized protein n=1 Tax=Punica granatum TaxID=22663 RepID=A0A218VYZ2_PUNGR|nr:hypothetical protein CDL15_Pgr009103 [Punica granatum]